MALDDASPTSSARFVTSVERIEEDACCTNGEREDDNDRESLECHLLSLGDKVLRQVSKEKTTIGV